MAYTARTRGISRLEKIESKIREIEDSFQPPNPLEDWSMEELKAVAFDDWSQLQEDQCQDLKRKVKHAEESAYFVKYR